MKNLTIKEIITIFIAAFLIAFSILAVLDYITMKTETRTVYYRETCNTRVEN